MSLPLLIILGHIHIQHYPHHKMYQNRIKQLLKVMIVEDITYAM